MKINMYFTILARLSHEKLETYLFQSKIKSLALHGVGYLEFLYSGF